MSDYFVEDEIKKMEHNELENALVVMSNTLARKQTLWSVRETKLFYSALSQIKTRDESNFVKLKKKDLIHKLKIDKRDTNKLRAMFQEVMKKSFVKFDGVTEEEWHDGFLIVEAKTTRNDVYVRFNDTFLPLLDQLENHFTMFELDNVAHFKSKYSILLFQNLKSWANPDYFVKNKKYTLAELKKMFEIKEGEYVRKTGVNKGIFDTSNFKKKTLDKAMQEINADIIKSGMCIREIKTIKCNGMVAGYDIYFCLINEKGEVIWNDPDVAEGQTSIDDFDF